MKINVTGKGSRFQYRLRKLMFEKNNPDIAVNMLFSNKKNIYAAHRSERNVKCKKPVHLLMVVDGENRHYTPIKSISRLLKSLNATHKGAYHFCMNCLNGFWTASARDKHYEYCSSNGHVKVNNPTEEKNFTMDSISLRFHLCCMQTLKVF